MYRNSVKFNTYLNVYDKYLLILIGFIKKKN